MQNWKEEFRKQFPFGDEKNEWCVSKVQNKYISRPIKQSSIVGEKIEGYIEQNFIHRDVVEREIHELNTPMPKGETNFSSAYDEGYHDALENVLDNLRNQ